MDLNRIALWLAAVPALSLLWYSARSPRRAFDWLVVSTVAVVVGAVGWFAFPGSVGYVSMALVVVTFVLPARLNNAAALAADRQGYDRAQLLARFAAWLHPTENWRITARMYEAFALAQSGHLGEAEALLQILSRGTGEIAQQAAGQRLALMNRWRELKSFAEREGLLALQTRPTLLLLYLRALGELGLIEELADFMRAQTRIITHSGAQSQALAYLFAFAGEPALTERAISVTSRGVSAETRDYWMAVALENGGKPEQARPIFARLRQSPDAILRGRAERHWSQLASAPTDLARSLHVSEIVRHFARMLSEGQRFSPHDFAGGKNAPITFGIGLVCIAIYLFGSWGNFAETNDAFAERWAFIAKDILEGEWWRTFSYMFVHQNWLHLLMNCFGLVVLGPFVERAFGRVRFCVVYFSSGFAGTAVYLALALLSPHGEKVSLVGASGCIMGLLGAHAAVMLRVWLKHRIALARQMFLRLLAMIGLQVVFDLTTPQIAALAHGAGLAFGFLCALGLRDELSSRAARQAS